MSDRFGAFRAAQEKQEEMHGDKYGKWAKKVYPVKKEDHGHGHGHDSHGHGGHDKHDDHGHDDHGGGHDSHEHKKQKPVLKFEFKTALTVPSFSEFVGKYTRENNLNQLSVIKSKEQLASIWDRWQTAEQAADTIKNFYTDVLAHDLALDAHHDHELQAVFKGIEAYTLQKAMTPERNPGSVAHFKIKDIERIQGLPPEKQLESIQKAGLTIECCDPATGQPDALRMATFQHNQELIVQRAQAKKAQSELFISKNAPDKIENPSAHERQAREEARFKQLEAQIKVLEAEMTANGLPLEDSTQDGLKEIKEKLKDIKTYQEHEKQIKKTSQALHKDAHVYGEKAQARVDALEAILNAQSKKEQLKIIDELSMRHRYVKRPGVLNLLSLIDRIDINNVKDDLNKLKAAVQQEGAGKKVYDQAREILAAGGTIDLNAPDRAAEHARSVLQQEEKALELGLKDRYMKKGIFNEAQLRLDAEHAAPSLDRQKALAHKIKQDLLSFKASGQSVLEGAQQTLKKNIERLIAEEPAMGTEATALKKERADFEATWEPFVGTERPAILAELAEKQTAYGVQKTALEKMQQELKNSPPADAVEREEQEKNIQNEQKMLKEAKAKIGALEQSLKKKSEPYEAGKKALDERTAALTAKKHRAEQTIVQYKKAKDSKNGYGATVAQDAQLVREVERLSKESKDAHETAVKNKIAEVLAMLEKPAVTYDNLKDRVRKLHLNAAENGNLKRALTARLKDSRTPLSADRMNWVLLLTKELTK